MENQAANALCVPSKGLLPGSHDVNDNRLRDQEHQQRVVVAKLQETQSSLKSYQETLRGKIDKCRNEIAEKRVEAEKRIAELKELHGVEIEQIKESNSQELAELREKRCVRVQCLKTMQNGLKAIAEEQVQIREQFIRDRDEFFQSLRRQKSEFAKTFANTFKKPCDGVESITDAVEAVTSRNPITLRMSNVTFAEVLPDPNNPVADRFNFAKWMLRNALNSSLFML